MRIFGVSILVGALIATISIVTFFVYQKGTVSNASEQQVTVQMSQLGDGSTVVQNDTTVTFSLYSDTFLYQTPVATGDPVATAYELLQKPITVQNDNVKGASTLDNVDTLSKSLLPPQIASQLTQTKRIDDQNDEGLKKIGKAARRSHIKFVQSIGGVPVFGSNVTVHTENDVKVYAMTGSVIQDKNIKGALLDETQTTADILKKQSEKAGEALTVVTVKKVLFNSSLVGVSADSATYPALAVTLHNKGSLPTFAHTIYASLVDGKILLDENLRHDARARSVYDCALKTTCTQVRTEGSVATGIQDVDITYDYFGAIYAFFSSILGRDSYDGFGGIMEAFVNVPDVIGSSMFCPNAAWFRGINYMLICPGWAQLDIITHEFTHGVTSATAGFINVNQSGALDEAIADIFAVNVDNDWDIAEGLSSGAIRHLDNPAANNPPSPDRLFDSKYYCSSGDNQGVHVNMAIPTKAYYLMTVGGQFNGCSLNGIGKEKAARIWYQALSRYLSAASNFRDAYNALVQSCNDLYGAASGECATTRAALQATEMDQQPLNTDSVNRCNGAVRQTPVCALPITNTSTPIPSIQCAPGDADCNGVANLSDYEFWRRSYLQINVISQTDFDRSGVTDIVDYEIWRRAYLRI